MLIRLYSFRLDSYSKLIISKRKKNTVEENVSLDAEYKISSKLEDKCSKHKLIMGKKK
jgi:hypothetical protein